MAPRPAAALAVLLLALPGCHTGDHTQTGDADAAADALDGLSTESFDTTPDGPLSDVTPDPGPCYAPRLVS